MNSIECVVGDRDGTGGAARYVLEAADRPSAFARSAYYTGADGESASDDSSPAWHGAPAALSQLGLTSGTSASRDDLVAALQGQHADTGAQVRRPGARTRLDGSAVNIEKVVKSVDLTFSAP